MASIKSLLKQIYFTDNYPEIKKHPIRTYKANQTYKKLSKSELDAYYDTLLNYPTDEEKEKHRHSATSAVLVKEHPEEFVRQLGQLKEYSDQMDGQLKENSDFDLKNNEIGIQIGKENPYVRNDVLYDIIMKNIRGDIEHKPIINASTYIQKPPIKEVYSEIYSKN